MLHNLPRFGNVTVALAAVALCASLFPGTAAAKGQSKPRPITVSPTITVSPVVTSSPNAPAILNIAVVPQIVVNALNRNSTITVTNITVICQQTSVSCNGG